jgi:hypothetical protein
MREFSRLGFTSIGSKACGGPTGFVAYSLKLNTTEFLDKAKTQIIRKNSIRNGVISTCDVSPSPTSIECEWYN